MLIQTIAALIVGFILGAAAFDALWRRQFEQAVKNILAILEPKEPGQTERKEA